MNVLKLLLFVGTDGRPHDYEGNGRYLTKLLNEVVEIEAMFSQDYEVLATGLNLFDAVLFYTDDVGKLSQTQERGLLHFIEAGGGFLDCTQQQARFATAKVIIVCPMPSWTGIARTWISQSASRTTRIQFLLAFPHLKSQTSCIT